MPSAPILSFGPYQLDTRAGKLMRGAEPVALSARQLALLRVLVSQAGQILTKDHLIEAAWEDVAVTDNSLEQAISSLRRVLDPAANTQYIETHARRGYRFAVGVERVEKRESDEALDALLAPHRAWIEGRASLETLEKSQISHARELFGELVSRLPTQAAVHVGLANACALQFEMTRADPEPDLAALEVAARHAREACRLDAQYGEAWATLGFVLERTGQKTDAVAAARRAVTLEPDNWRHQIRLAAAGWGEVRLRASKRALALLPGCPLAHWLAATVHVARQALDEAEHELAAGLALQDDQPVEHSRLASVGLDWLAGLLYLARDDDERALAAFERELSAEPAGHLYARECCSNAWYAIGALHFRRRQWEEARTAFLQAVKRVAAHPTAHVGLGALDRIAPTTADRARPPLPERRGDRPLPFEAVMAQTAILKLMGQNEGAAQYMAEALAQAPPGNAGWLLPIEPLLHISDHPAIWTAPLARLRARAA